MAAKTSWHRYESKLRHCHSVYTAIWRIPDTFKTYISRMRIAESATHQRLQSQAQDLVPSGSTGPPDGTSGGTLCWKWNRGTQSGLRAAAAARDQSIWARRINERTDGGDGALYMAPWRRCPAAIQQFTPALVNSFTTAVPRPPARTHAETDTANPHCSHSAPSIHVKLHSTVQRS